MQFIALNGYINIVNNEESEWNFKLRVGGKKKPKSSIKRKTKIKQILVRSRTDNSRIVNKAKWWFFEKINKIDNHQLDSRKEERTKI